MKQDLPMLAPGLHPTSAALADLAQIRFEQVYLHGHTAEADRATPLKHLPREADARVRAVFDDIDRGKRDLARIHALRAAALLLAFVDRLDADAADQQGAGGVL